MLVEKSYQILSEMIESVEPSSAFVEEFNEIALGLEYRPNDELEFLPSLETRDAWRAQMEKGKLWLVSPWIVENTRKFKLCVNALNPVHDKHVNARIIFNDDDTISRSPSPCIITGGDLTMIFAVWDFIAREGISVSESAGIITKSWLNAVLSRLPCQQGVMDTETAALIEHASKMFDLAQFTNNVQLACNTYQKLHVSDYHDTNTRAMLYNNNKIRFYLISRNILEIESVYDLEFVEFVKIQEARKKPAIFAKWLLDANRLHHFTITRSRAYHERKIYPVRAERDLARAIRDRRIPISNAPRPGAIPVSLIPAGWESSKFHELEGSMIENMHPLSNKRAAYEKCLKKLARGMESTNGIYYARKFSHVDRVNSSRVRGFHFTFRHYKLCMIDTLEMKSIVISYYITT